MYIIYQEQIHKFIKLLLRHSEEGNSESGYGNIDIESESESGYKDIGEAEGWSKGKWESE